MYKLRINRKDKSKEVEYKEFEKFKDMKNACNSYNNDNDIEKISITVPSS